MLDLVKGSLASVPDLHHNQSYTCTEGDEGLEMRLNDHHYFIYSHSYTLSHAGPTNTSPPNEVKLEHFEMNTNDAYATNTAEIAITGNVAYMTTGDTIPATQNVAYGQVPAGTDDCYDYVI